METHFTATIESGCGHSPPVSAVRIQVMHNGESIGDVWFDPAADGYRFFGRRPLDHGTYAAVVALLLADGIRLAD